MPVMNSWHLTRLLNWLKVGLGTAVYLSLMHAVIEAFIDKNTTPLQ